MASTNSDSVIWVVGEAAGVNGSGGTAAIPQGPVLHATATTVPTAAPFGYNVHITSDDDLYLWDANAWVGPYSLAT